MPMVFLGHVSQVASRLCAASELANISRPKKKLQRQQSPRFRLMIRIP
jgi:hypothetical protein